VSIAAAIFVAWIANEGYADTADLESAVRNKSTAIEKKIITWRRDIHEHPELSDQETRTAKLVADHLRELGLDVRTEVARTGVVGILKGAKPGPTVALRADMDALPVKEPTKLPFGSKATAKIHGKTVPVMHACGHDTHTAMLMGVAEVLAGLKSDLSGTVVFIFQPTEEGSSIVEPSSGKSWGAKLMLEEGLFNELKPGAVFAVHVMPGPSGQISYRSGPATNGYSAKLFGLSQSPVLLAGVENRPKSMYLNGDAYPKLPSHRRLPRTRRR
jgi:amidohydrolase